MPNLAAGNTLSGNLPNELPGATLPDRDASIGNLRAEIYKQINLPPPIKFFSKEGALAPEFITLVTSLHSQMIDALPPPTGNRTKDKINGWALSRGGVPESKESLSNRWLTEFPARFAKLDHFAQALVTEVFTLAAEIQKADGVFAARSLFPQQQAILTWFGMALATSTYKGASNRTFLIDSPHGTGKTEILGMINTAAFRANVRNDLPYITAYIAARGYAGGQQVVGLEQVSRLVTHAYPEKFTEGDLSEMLRYFAREIRSCSELFRFSNWRDFLDAHSEGFTTSAEAEKELTAYLQKTKILERLDKSPAEVAGAVKELSLWFSHQAALVRKNESGNMILLRFPQQDADEDGRASNRFCGDIVRGLPEEISAGGLIYSSRFPNSALHRYSRENRGKIDGDAVLRRTYLAVLSEHDAHLGKRRLPHNDTILDQASLLLVDEAGRRAGGERQKIVSHPKIPPIVVATTYTKSRMPVAFSYDAVSPQPSLVTSFEHGILPAMAESISPAKSSAHVSYRTKESVNAIVENHFESLPLYRELNLMQPHRGRTIVVVEKAMAVAVADALRAEYAKRRIPAVVVPLSVNTGSATLDKFMSRTLAWMVSWKGHTEDGKMPPFAQVLVSHSTAVIDGLNIPDVNITIADPKAMNHDALVRLAMRAARGHTPQTPNSQYRGLVKTIRFLIDGEVAGSTFSNTVASVLNPDFGKRESRKLGEISLIQGGVILPAVLAAKEAAIAQRARISATRVPYSPAAARLVTRAAEATPLQTASVSPEDDAFPNRPYIQKPAPLSVTPQSLNARDYATFQQYKTAVLGIQRGMWDDVNEAMNSSARQLPEEWKLRWRGNLAKNLENTRNVLRIALDTLSINSPQFGEIVADTIVAQLGIVIAK